LNQFYENYLLPYSIVLSFNLFLLCRPNSITSQTKNFII